jgi:hypothetical protein
MVKDMTFFMCGRSIFDIAGVGFFYLVAKLFF